MLILYYLLKIMRTFGTVYFFLFMSFYVNWIYLFWNHMLEASSISTNSKSTYNSLCISFWRYCHIGAISILSIRISIAITVYLKPSRDLSAVVDNLIRFNRFYLFYSVLLLNFHSLLGNIVYSPISMLFFQV